MRPIFRGALGKTKTPKTGGGHSEDMHIAQIPKSISLKIRQLEPKMRILLAYMSNFS